VACDTPDRRGEFPLREPPGLKVRALIHSLKVCGRRVAGTAGAGGHGCDAFTEPTSGISTTCLGHEPDLELMSSEHIAP